MSHLFGTEKVLCVTASWQFQNLVTQTTVEKTLISQAIHRIRIILLQLNADIDHDCSTYQGDGCHACCAVDNLGDMIEAAVRDTFKVEDEKQKMLDREWATV